MRLSNLPSITQLVSEKAGIQSEICLCHHRPSLPQLASTDPSWELFLVSKELRREPISSKEANKQSIETNFLDKPHSVLHDIYVHTNLCASMIFASFLFTVTQDHQFLSLGHVLYLKNYFLLNRAFYSGDFR